MHLSQRVTEEKITHQALIIVGDVLIAKETGIIKKSKLYDKNFKHEYR
jgi:precorrin-4/cobalt-precorrin-4 C11-methyltransferase